MQFGVAMTSLLQLLMTGRGDSVVASMHLLKNSSRDVVGGRPKQVSSCHHLLALDEAVKIFCSSLSPLDGVVLLD